MSKNVRPEIKHRKCSTGILKTNSQNVALLYDSSYSLETFEN